MSTDISKLRPELLDISDAEFERRKAEMQLAEIERENRRKEAERASILEQAQARYEDMMEGINFLHEHEFLPQRLIDALTTKDGSFAPFRFIKRPRT